MPLERRDLPQLGCPEAVRLIVAAAAARQITFQNPNDSPSSIDPPQLRLLDRVSLILRGCVAVATMAQQPGDVHARLAER